jgi:molybdate transport system ATP-binding protein
MVEGAERVNVLKAELRLRLSSAFELDCRFEVPTGFTVLFGPSGAGKTSVLDCIAGIKRPHAGIVSINGSSLFESAKQIDLPSSRRRLAYVFQDLALFPHLNVRENIAYGLKAESPESGGVACRRILYQFGIDHLCTRFPGDLSGGERQRVALARSLVTNPQALLLDEPLAGLDRATRMKIVDDLRSWNVVHQIPILYVTHSVREAVALGERALIMREGRIVAEGTPSELLDVDNWE